MKTPLLLFSAMTLIHVTSFAQPTINIGDVTPTIGSSLTFADATYADPGSAGANQTWDLSGMVPENATTSNFLAPAGLPESNSFIGATHVAFVQFADLYERFGYSAFADNKIEDLGFHSITPNTSFLLTYSDPRTVLVFPLTYNDSFSDTFENGSEAEVDTEGEIMTIETAEAGTINAVVDGYGSLVTPAGIYSDVLRVRYDIEKSSSVTYNGEDTFTGESVEVEFQFYKSGYPMPLATLNTNSLLFMGEVVDVSTSGNYFMDMSVGVEENEPYFSNVQFFPMPASTHIDLQLNSKSGTQTNFALLSSTGKMVHQWNQQPLQSGLNQLRLELPELATGTYLLLIKSADGMHTERVVIGR